MSLFLVLFMNLSALGAELPQIVLKVVPPGWVTDETSYVMNEEAARETYAAIRTYREERDAWVNAYYDLKGNSESFAESQRKLLTDLREQLNDERNEWRTVLRRARSPGLGVFAGAGYTGSGVEAVIGVGIVWKIL
jgi:hypothetical protein